MACRHHVLLLSLLAAGCAGSCELEHGDACEAAEDDWGLDELADQEAELVEVTLLQTQFKQQRGVVTETLSKNNYNGAASSEALVDEQADKAVAKAAEHHEAEDEHVISLDHNGNVCMLCNKPLPERVGDRQYTEQRTDCGRRSAPTGPSAEDMARPAVQLWQRGPTAGQQLESNGFCELNFAKSCADAVANKDYLYWPKSFDLRHPAMRPNVGWDSRYCRLNGFLDKSVVKLQHNFTGLQQKAQELCQTKYAKHGIESLTFMDMLELSKHEDSSAPSLEEAERMAAWNCAMGDLGCDMAMCAYSFCQQGGGIGLYEECKGWDQVKGMPF